MGLAQTSSSAQEKFWGSLLRKYGPTAAKLAGHAIKAYMGLAQTGTSAEEKAKLLGMALRAASVTARHFSLSQNATAAQTKFWGSLLRKYGPTAAKLAGHAIKAYMGLAQTSTTAVEKEKWLGMALGAAHLGWNMYKHFSLIETSATAEERFGWMKAFKKYAPVAINLAKHAYNAYNSLAQTNATAVQKEKWLGMALKAAHMGYNLWKATRLAETSSASKLKFGWFKAIKKYGPTAIKLAGQAYHAYNNAAQTSAAAKELSWWSHAIKAATHAVKKYGPTAIKMAKAGYHAYNSAQTSAAARELSWWRSAIKIAKKYGPTAIKMAKAGYKAYNSAQTGAQRRSPGKQRKVSAKVKAGICRNYPNLRWCKK